MVLFRLTSGAGMESSSRISKSIAEPREDSLRLRTVRGQKDVMGMCEQLGSERTEIVTSNGYVRRWEWAMF